MKALVACLLVLATFTSAAVGQRQNPRRSQNTGAAPRTQTIRICQGVPMPDGYVIVAYLTSTACPHGAYVLRKQDQYESSLGVTRNAAAPRDSGATSTDTENQSAPVAAPKVKAARNSVRQPTSPSPAKTSTPSTGNPASRNGGVASASRPRIVGTQQPQESQDEAGPPTLIGSDPARPLRPPQLAKAGSIPETPTIDPTVTGAAPEPTPEEVDEGDVVRVDTTVVTVPVSVLDRQGRFIPNLKKEDFSLLENGEEQSIAYFETAEKPFTVALLLDTSASTQFRLSEIKAAAVAFAQQLRPQDRVLVVTFNSEVLLLTEPWHGTADPVGVAYALGLAAESAGDCADSGTHYVDLGGLFHTTRRQLLLHDRFVAAGVTAVIGMGSSPGTTNVMAAYAGSGLASVHEVHVRVGIAGFAPWTAPLPVPFAIDTLPAVTYADGGWAEVPAMSALEEIDFPAPVGRLTLGHALHSEVATLPRYFAEQGVRTVSFKIGFPTEFMTRMSLLTGLGLARTEPLEVDQQRVVPRAVLRRCIETTTPALAPEARPGDAEALSVRLTGQDHDERDVEVLAECLVRPYPPWEAGAGQLDTGVPPSIVAQFLAWGVIDRPGVFAPEDIVPPKPFFEELASRFMTVDLIARAHAADDPMRGWSYEASGTNVRPREPVGLPAAG